MSNEIIQEKILVYSSYGYVRVNKKDFEEEKEMLGFIREMGSLNGTINKKSITNRINIELKTFHGLRKTYNIIINLDEPLSKIINILQKIEDNYIINENENEYFDDIEKNHLKEIKLENFDELIKLSPKKLKKWNISNQYRLIYTSGTIRELNPSKTPQDERIQENGRILLLKENSHKFSETFKSTKIFLESKGKVALKQGDDELQLVLSDKYFTHGRKYIEFILQTEPYESSVIIGISLKRNDYNLFLNDPLYFWGYILSDCKKICFTPTNKFESVKYGEPTKIGDRIGILLQFNNNKSLDVSYYINRINMGIAFKDLPIKQYYFAVALRFDSTRIRIAKNLGFPDV